MQICSNGHEEVVFDDRMPCPLCEALDKVNMLEDENGKLEEKVNMLEDEIVELEEKLREETTE